jgi:hypothetical protein
LIVLTAVAYPTRTFLQQGIAGAAVGGFLCDDAGGRLLMKEEQP